MFREGKVTVSTAHNPRTRAVELQTPSYLSESFSFWQLRFHVSYTTGLSGLGFNWFKSYPWENWIRKNMTSSNSDNLTSASLPPTKFAYDCLPHMFLRDCDRDQLGVAVDHSISGQWPQQTRFRVKRQQADDSRLFQRFGKLYLAATCWSFLVNRSERNGLFIIDNPMQNQTELSSTLCKE